VYINSACTSIGSHLFSILSPCHARYSITRSRPARPEGFPLPRSRRAPAPPSGAFKILPAAKCVPPNKNSIELLRHWVSPTKRYPMVPRRKVLEHSVDVTAQDEHTWIPLHRPSQWYLPNLMLEICVEGEVPHV